MGTRLLAIIVCGFFSFGSVAGNPTDPVPVPPMPAPAPGPNPVPVPPAPLPVSPPSIAGADQFDPYKIVRLTAVNVPPNTGVLWHARQQPGSPKPDFGQSGDRSLTTFEFTGAPGVYDIELTLVTIGAGGKPILSELTKTITIGSPAPPVPPAPTPKPVPPTPDPAPAPAGTGAYAIVIADESNPTQVQETVIQGATLTALKVAGKCRVYGSVSDAEKITKQHYDAMIADAKKADASFAIPALFVLDASGKLVSFSKLPTTEAALAAVLKGKMAP